MILPQLGSIAFGVVQFSTKPVWKGVVFAQANDGF